MARKRKCFPLRIDPGVHAALERWAADELRSVNGQIEYLLRRAMVDAGRLNKHQAPGPVDPHDAGFEP